MSSEDKRGVTIRKRVVSPEVQRRENVAVTKTQNGFTHFYTRVELLALSDSELLKVILNTPHHRISIEALGIAMDRPTLQENPFIVTHARRAEQTRQQEINARDVAYEEKRKAELAVFTQPQVEGLPSMDKRWFSVWIEGEPSMGGLWRGVIFGTQETVIGAAYCKYKQEQTLTDPKARISVRELPHLVLPN